MSEARMPWAFSEYSARWMAAASASAAGIGLRLCCRCQYCITMAMLAAPQPFFSCLIKGTSSHMPGLCARKTMPQRHSIVASLRGKPGFMRAHSPDCDNNEHEHGDRQNDPEYFTLA